MLDLLLEDVMDIDPFLVSVCVITYNHEKYIRQALESILAQTTSFPIEILIGEDCSTDGTRKIILEFEKRYPERIRAILSKVNMGANRNLIRTLEDCKGKYIAVLEGDDYWLSPLKLQKQVDFLESHPECTICFHPVEVFFQEIGMKRGVWPDYNVDEITTLTDLIKNNYIPTCSVMYRNIQINKIPDMYYDLKSGDWPLHVMYAQLGNIGYLADVMALYRYHSTGVFSRLNFVQKLKTALMAREFVYSQIPDVPKKELGVVIINNYFHIANLYCDQNNISKAREYLRRSLSYLAYFIYFPDKLYVAKVFLRTFLPGMFSYIFSKKRNFLKRDS
ncbi:MAG TPA: hypothetical protein DIW27_01515 [Cytophagales bacterium]|nr:hypothetical protein [Cytophagales bacterium]